MNNNNNNSNNNNNNNTPTFPEEEFTFPIITTNKVVHLTLLPPLWRVSSINQSKDGGGGGDLGDDIGQGIFVRKRTLEQYLQSRVCGNIKNNDKYEDGDGEKMDLLWEDFFKEELLQVRINNDDNDDDDDDDDDLKEEFEDGESLNIPRITKRKNLELVGKILKMVFLVQSTINKTKRGHD